MATKKKAVKLPARKLLPEEERFSPFIEDALAEVSEKIFYRLHGDGFIAKRLFEDTNVGEDILSAIEDELRKCIRG